MEDGSGVGGQRDGLFCCVEAGLRDGDGVVAEGEGWDGEGAVLCGGGGFGEGGVGCAEFDVGVGDGAVLGVVNDAVELAEDGGSRGDGCREMTGDRVEQACAWDFLVRGLTELKLRNRTAGACLANRREGTSLLVGSLRGEEGGPRFWRERSRATRARASVWVLTEGWLTISAKMREAVWDERSPCWIWVDGRGIGGALLRDRREVDARTGGFCLLHVPHAVMRATPSATGRKIRCGAGCESQQRRDQR